MTYFAVWAIVVKYAPKFVRSSNAVGVAGSHRPFSFLASLPDIIPRRCCMHIKKLWREIYLTLMIGIALAVIFVAATSLKDLPGLGLTAVGVFVAVLGVGLYDQWSDPAFQKINIKERRRR